MSNLERRFCPRVSTKLSVYYSHYRKQNQKRSRTTRIIARGEKAFGYSVDVSCSGMLLETTNPHLEGTYLDMRITLDEETLKATAKIVHVKKKENNRYTMGVRFLQMPERDRQKLFQFIQQQLECAFAPAPA